jgi:hypothetical protein
LRVADAHPTNDDGFEKRTFTSVSFFQPKGQSVISQITSTMKLTNSAILCIFLPKICYGFFPLRKVFTLMSSAHTPSLDTDRVDDVQCTSDETKALLTTDPVAGNCTTTVLAKVVSPEHSALALDSAQTVTTSKFSSTMGAVSPTRWVMLLSSIAPVSLIDKIVGSVLGQPLSFEQQGIVRAVLQAYQVFALAALTSMSLPPHCTKALWITYTTTRFLPQRSRLLQIVRAVAALRSDLPSLQRFSMAKLQVGALLAGMVVLPLLFYGGRSLTSQSNPRNQVLSLLTVSSLYKATKRSFALANL